MLAVLIGCTRTPPLSSPSPSPAAQRESLPKIKHGEVVKAVIQGNEEKVLKLLNAGADINENIADGADRVTPLIAAIVTHNSSMAAILIRNGAALDPTYQGYSAEDLAHYFNDEDTSQLIRQYRGILRKKGGA